MSKVWRLQCRKRAEEVTYAWEMGEITGGIVTEELTDASKELRPLYVDLPAKDRTVR